MAALSREEPAWEVPVHYQGRETFKALLRPPKSWRHGPLPGRVVAAFTAAFNAQFREQTFLEAFDVELRSPDGPVPLAATKDALPAALAARPRRDGARLYAPGDAVLGWPRGRAVGDGEDGEYAPPEADPGPGPAAAKALAKLAQKAAALVAKCAAEADGEERLRLAHAALGLAPGDVNAARAYATALATTRRWGRLADFLAAEDCARLCAGPEDAAVAGAQKRAKIEGDALYDAGRFAEAAQAYGRGLTAMHPTLAADRALALARSGDYAAAAAAYGVAVDANPRDWRMLMCRARCALTAAARGLSGVEARDPRRTVAKTDAAAAREALRLRLNHLAKAEGHAELARDDLKELAKRHSRAPLDDDASLGPALDAAAACCGAVLAALGRRRELTWEAGKARARLDAHGEGADDAAAFRAGLGEEAAKKRERRRAEARRRGLSHYELLGVAKDADAATVKKAYRRKALETHPDKNLGNPGAEAAFLRVQEAARVLGDPDLRRLYDLEVAGGGDVV